MSFTTSIFKRKKKKSMHKWVISIKVLRAVWKVNTIVYSQLYLRQTTTNFQLIMDNIPVVVSNSCLKKKKKPKQTKKKPRSWLVIQINCHQCLWPVSELITNWTHPNEEEDLTKEYLLHSRAGADCSRYVSTCILSHTHLSFQWNCR